MFVLTLDGIGSLLSYKTSSRIKYGNLLYQ